MGRFGIGQAVRRLEDERLITGHGRYVDDVQPPGTVQAVFLRSPHAHARIAALDPAPARAMPGVLAVLTIDDLDAAGLGPLPCKAQPRQRDGRPMAAPERPALARGHVRHVGEPVALVVAETADQARDAAEAILVAYEALPSITDLAAAVEPGAAVVWPEAPDNVALDWQAGDGAAVDRLFAAAHRISSVELVNNRVAPSPMEPRGCLAEYDAASDSYTFRAGGQGVHSMQQVLAENILHIAKERLRVIQSDVGGGFGMKIFVFPEYPACLHAAKLTGRPVKWVAERGESFLSDSHGRDHVTRVEIATDASGRMTALRATTIANLGAYLSQFGPFIPTDAGAKMYNGVYRFEAVHFQVRCAFTHTVPVDAYRGAGRPEAAYAVERAVDHVARDLGLEVAELRRRNFIPPDAMPFRTAMQTTYDSGEFQRLMESALSRADAAGFAARRAEAKRRGRRLGLGTAYYIEQCSGGGDEAAKLEVTGDGRVRLYIGTQSNGQGHATAYAQILADALGVPHDAVETIQGDTALVATGRGTGGSRSVPVGGVAVQHAARNVVENGTSLAADMLEAATADIRFEEGRYQIVGTDRSVGLFEVAAKAGTDGLGGNGSWGPEIATFPNGCHVCEIEIDEASGVPAIVRYTIVDDFGTVINPLMLEGQVHGGVVQGVGQALLEEAVYDHGSGQLIAGSFMDYAMPRADCMAPIDFSTIAVPCRTNPLGMKGAGEAGAIGAPPAVINAIVDALADLGVTHVDMPATPERLWRLMQAQQAA